ncbi:MAG: hypothetical protein IJ870_02320 [Alphaproteobacteria bacterium]|nr:hypothetical protein [Alphaproteobacteria bacterium]
MKTKIPMSCLRALKNARIRHPKTITVDPLSSQAKLARGVTEEDNGARGVTIERGRSMVEMLGVLAIIGVLSAGALAGYSKAMAKNKMNKTAEQISMMITNIETRFINEEDYSGLGSDPATGTINAISLGVVPDEMISEDRRTLKNAYQDSVQIYSVPYGGLEHGAYKVDYHGLPKEAVIYFATPTSNVENSVMMNVSINE